MIDYTIPMKDHTHLFTLRIGQKWFFQSLNHAGSIICPMIIIRAFDSGGRDLHATHTRIDVEVKQGGKIIFPRGFLYYGVPSTICLDGPWSKEAALNLVSMHPHNPDAKYFRGFTPEQLSWVKEYGKKLSLIGLFRYCNKNGTLRK
jgi:hypothetical protein